MKFKNGISKLREKKGDASCSAVFAGDCCPWESGEKIVQSGRTEELAGAVKPFISGADLRIVQFEVPLTNGDAPIDKSGPNLKCSPDVLELLSFLDFQVALLANNHTGDHGGKITMETIERLEAAGIQTVGAGANIVEAAKPLYLESHGVSINVLNFAEHEFGTATATTPGCAPLDPLDNITAIQKAGETADLVIVAIHGGHERNPLPSPRMIQTYRAFADAGAAAVFNCHTHCPEPIEIWNGIPIIYSPGNFYFPWDDLSSDHLSSLWWRGYLPKLHLDKTGVHAVEIMPYGFDNERIFTLTNDAEAGFFEYMETLSLLLADEEKVITYFEAWVAHHGETYLGWLRDRLASWPIELSDRAAVREMLPVRNLYTCESHNDLVKKYLRLLEEGRIPKAMEGWPDVEKLRTPEWAVDGEADRL